jgi:NAD(P)-dependent dehydrogenase (short-subunit alcohol dehydrogenase family)
MYARPNKQQTFLITGCSSGIGIETARALAATGARVFLGVRSLEKGRTACSSFLESGRVELLELDVASLASVRKAAAEFLEKSSELHILVCNAGIMLVPERETSVDGFESQLATNYLGHFLLFWLLKDAMLKASTPEFNARLVNVSSAGHHGADISFDDINLAEEGAYNGSKAYGQSKIAQIFMANYVDRHFGPKGIHAWSLMPGGIMTNLQQHVDEETKSGWAKDTNINNFMKSEAQGAATTVLAAVSREWEGQGGKYLEDCRFATPTPLIPWTCGHEPYIYDEAKEDRLWDFTRDLLKLS